MDSSLSVIDEIFYPYGLFLFIIVGIIESYFLLRVEGKMKRGFKIWSKPLPNGAYEYLTNLSQDLIELSSKRSFIALYSFMRVEYGEAIISYRKPNWNTSWPYVGYVDLTCSNPKLEYRAALTMHLLIFTLAFIGPFVPFLLFVLLMMGINFRTETKAIDGFINEKVNLWRLHNKEITR